MTKKMAGKKIWVIVISENNISLVEREIVNKTSMNYICRSHTNRIESDRRDYVKLEDGYEIFEDALSVYKKVIREYIIETKFLLARFERQLNSPVIVKV